MIIRLRGSVQKLHPTSVELEVSNVTYKVEISLFTSTFLQEKRDSSAQNSAQQHVVELEIAQIIRQDSNSLYGFTTKEERETFLRIIKVNGVGPKLALAILSTYPVQHFISIIKNQDLLSLKGVKGVGSKVAGKIMLELAGFVRDAESDTNNSSRLIRDALFSLGFKDSDIDTAIKALGPKLESTSPSDLVKEALRVLSK